MTRESLPPMPPSPTPLAQAGYTRTHHSIPYEGRVFCIEHDTIRHVSGYTTIRDVVRHNGGAVAVAVFDNRDVLLIRQFRYPMQDFVLELPAGKLDPGEDPAVCALRELEEETGWRAEHVEKLTSLLTTPGFCSEVLHIHLATGLTRGTQALEQGEEHIEVLRMPLDTAVAMCASGAIIDGKTIAGLMLAKLRLDATL